jgi:hypothetical protein
MERPLKPYKVLIYLSWYALFISMGVVILQYLGDKVDDGMAMLGLILSGGYAMGVSLFYLLYSLSMLKRKLDYVLFIMGEGIILLLTWQIFFKHS